MGTDVLAGLVVIGQGVIVLNESEFRLDIRKKFFMMRVVRHWHRLPKEVLDAPSLETFKAKLDGAPSNLIKLKVSLLTAGGLGLMTSKGAFQPKLFYDSLILPLCPIVLGQKLRVTSFSLAAKCSSYGCPLASLPQICHYSTFP